MDQDPGNTCRADLIHVAMQVLEVSPSVAAVYVALASGVLVSLYFLIDYMYQIIVRPLLKALSRRPWLNANGLDGTVGPCCEQVSIAVQVALICLIAQPTIVMGALSLLGRGWPAAERQTIRLPQPGGQSLRVPTALFVIVPASLTLAALWATHRTSPVAVSLQGR